MRGTALVFASIFVAACAAQPATRVVDLPGARNAAFRDAASRYGLSEDWLVAIAYQQGRLEPADAADDGVDPSMATGPIDASDPAATLDADTPVDEVDPDPDNSPDAPDPAIDQRSWGLMYLTDVQVARAAALTGLTPDAIRGELGANVDAAAALLADAGGAGGDDALRAATTTFLGVTDDAADLALHDLDDVIANGFDLTTEDGERVALVGADPQPEVDPSDAGELGTGGQVAEARVAPGHYPRVQWIRSPNFGSRLGAHIHYVIIHDMEGTMPAAISIFKNPANQVSAHYLVRSRDGHIVKMVRETQDAWHAGHGWFNRHSIGIEHEGFAHRKRGGGYYTDRLYQASAQLTCAIAHRYHIPVDRKHIFGHENVPSDLASHTLCSDRRGNAGACGGVSHHTDPGPYWDWHEYMHLVATCVRAAG